MEYQRESILCVAFEMILLLMYFPSGKRLSCGITSGLDGCASVAILRAGKLWYGGRL